MSDTFPRTTHNKPLKFVPLRSTGRELRSRRLAGRYASRGQRMEYDTDKIDEAVLAILYLTLHDGDRVWKSIDWDALSRLHVKGYIPSPKGKAKSVCLTDEGLKDAQHLCEKYFGGVPGE
ncbi:MAG: DUF6429 family protein [Pseudohongiellaceae bacterium]